MGVARVGRRRVVPGDRGADRGGGAWSGGAAEHGASAGAADHGPGGGEEERDGAAGERGVGSGGEHGAGRAYRASAASEPERSGTDGAALLRPGGTDDDRQVRAGGPAAARGWHWVVRLTGAGSHRFRDHLGREPALKTLLDRVVPTPGRRGKARGQLFKGAGWRDASIIATWAPGATERLVVLTDLPPTWEPLRVYDRRFWIEAGTRPRGGSGKPAASPPSPASNACWSPWPGPPSS